MNEQELKAYATAKGWKFVYVRALPLHGYWKDAEGKCYYAKEVIETVKKERGK